jgi:predicted ATPase
VRADLPSGTVTFLFTDVEGSTRLLHDLGAEAYAAELAEHRRLIREACASHGGVEVDTQGDAFFLAFPTAPGALAAAGEMTEALTSGPIRVRLGLHTGTPLLTDEGYIGGDVHFAARVAASAHGGQVVLSSATADLVELPLTDLGEHRLKDIEGAVAIFQLGDGQFPPLKTISNTNLPRPASSFVGRDRELEEALARVQDGARLLTLTGPGGSGKTRLAIEAAALLVPEYKAGVFWVGLEALRDPALVTETISQTLGAKDGLADYIAEREMLLLLDNLEQVIEAAPELSALLSACPNLTLLVTSRELLRVQGEVEYPVPPLAQPEAVSLFCARAQLQPAAEIAELCARLDNLPLAVELAAARTKALTPTQILERLFSRLDLFKGGRDADPRQQTLRATIEWSYELLSPQERQLFARLSVFAGGCTLDAAEEVCDADLETLQSLVEKSLLRFTTSEAGSRYWMLETIREYAGDRLDALGETADSRRRHAKWCVGLTADRPSGPREDRPEALQRFGREHDNIRAGLAWLLEAVSTDSPSSSGRCGSSG